MPTPAHTTNSHMPLLQPYTLGDLPLPNRIAMAPLTRCRATNDRVPTPIMAEYYRQRASAGLIIAEATIVDPHGAGYSNTPGIYTDAQANNWRTVTDTVHDAGGRIFLQLWHCGRASHSDFHNGALPIAPSAIPIKGEGLYTPSGQKKLHETPRALETHEIPAVVAQFRRGARLARQANFDGVEIHAANGYLIDQFLQSKTNHRTDHYGGSIPNRVRFLREVVEAVAAEWPTARIGVRLAPNGVFSDMGSPDFRETFSHAAEQLSPFGLAYLHLLDGLAFGSHGLGQPMTLAEFRPLFRGALIGNCGYTRDAGNAAIAEGHADMIAYGRPFISNPDLVERFAGGHELNPEAPLSVWYSGGEAGYTDFPSLAHAARATPD